MMEERPAKKRKRDIKDVDVDLVSIYDNLANENEKARLKAAGQLLARTFRSEASQTEEQLTTILKRLFRGLCSSRKAARLGFAVALTEFLAQLQSPDYAVTRSKLVDLLDSTTAPDGGARGQEERDHYFGRIFGAEAIIKSNILFDAQDRIQWKRLLNLLCAVATKKPWLRQECGWILCQLAAESSETLRPFVEDAIETLIAEKLIRTPEGVAIWLTAKKAYPDSKLSKHAWKHSHPLASKDIQALAGVMKNARSQEQDAEFGAQGSTSWSASLHFVWTVVLRFLFEQDRQVPSKAKDKNQKKDLVELVTFDQFWKVVVDDGLFGTSSSAERKLWGVLLFTQAVLAAPPSSLSATLSERALYCMITSLNGDDRYLQNSTTSALQTLEKRFKTTRWTQHPEAGAECLKRILEATKFADFDGKTKTKVVTTLLETGDSRHLWAMLQNLRKERIETADRTSESRILISLEAKLVAACLRRADQESDAESLSGEILMTWFRIVDLHTDNVQQYLKDRISAALEQALKGGAAGRRMFMTALTIENLKMATTDEAISKTMRKAEKRLRKLDKMAAKQRNGLVDGSSSSRKSPATSLTEGFQLLYRLVAFDIYNGEQESVEIMQDLLDLDVPDSNQDGQSTDALLEILLSFSSRPSKFLRRLTPMIFEALASGLTDEGLRSLTRVLLSKENTQGQQEMFEGADETMGDDGEGESDREDSDEFDSDVEVVDASSGPRDASDAEVSGDDDDPSDEDEPEDGEDELSAFNAALASALGDARGDLGEGSDSDSDMDDDQMMELDEKLTEVFKARKVATSKKKDNKDAKENVINFKNRVLDLLEVYIKHQYQNPHAVELILPLLVAMRTTQAKQVAERCSKALKDLCARCKGQQNIPVVSTGMLDELMETLDEVHREACMEASNMHASAASQASILLVKMAIKSGADVDRAVQVYGRTMTRMLTDAKCKVQPGFFTDWNNWCTSSRSWTASMVSNSE